MSVVAPGSEAAEVTDAEVAAHMERVPDVLRPTFSGIALARMTDAIAAALADQVEAGVRDVGGGTREVEFLEVDIRAADADVTARAFIWLRTDPVDNKSAFQSVTSEGWWLFKFHLVATPGGWRIDLWSAVPE